MNAETIKCGFKYGAPWGLVMFFIVYITPILDGGKTAPLKIITGLIIWMIAGWIFGLWMNHILKKTKQEK